MGYVYFFTFTSKGRVDEEEGKGKEREGIGKRRG